MINSNPIKIVVNNNETDGKLIDIKIIKSPTKYEILELLKNNEMRYEDIVSNISKSKATISMHLKHLREEGIVNYKADPNDNRKKIFYLRSEILGGVDTAKIKNADKEQTDNMIGRFIEEGNIEYTLMLVHTFKTMLSELGIDIDYIVKLIGNKIGEYLSKQLYDEDFDTYCDNIKRYWSENNLGDLSFEYDNILKVSCENCFECASLPKLGKPSCFLQEGMFERLFENYFKFKVNILEVECYSMGDERCLFEIQP